jgi:prepilin-type processing-associated H-X9-DG protein
MMTRPRAASGFTLIELLTCVAIGIILIAILFPVFARPRGCGGRSSYCEDRLKWLGTAMTMYLQDYDDTYPTSGAVGKDRQSEAEEQPSYGRTYSQLSSRWVVQLLPYVPTSTRFVCRQDAWKSRNQSDALTPYSWTPFPVSYGPNRLFVDPAAYGWKKRALKTTDVEHPERKYLLADCATAHGFDPETVAYLRYPNYDPSEPQHGWTPEQYLAAGRVAWPEKVAKPMTRHAMVSSILFADGHVGSLRHDEIPNNDGPRGPEYQALVEAMVPWQ